MKRADQHDVSVQPVHNDTYVPSMMLPDETGVDAPSEKEIPVPEQTQKPTMGALPVDTPGSKKHNNEWQSTTVDESHQGEIIDEEETSDDSIVATGSGPDPEHADDNL
jgi:hypothetical protein